MSSDSASAVAASAIAASPAVATHRYSRYYQSCSAESSSAAPAPAPEPDRCPAFGSAHQTCLALDSASAGSDSASGLTASAAAA